jgi:hypothetical protein
MDRPAEICRQLLAALDASEGRRRRRRRDTSPDAIGMTVKRGLLEDAVREDPEPDTFEGWLLERCEAEAVDHEDGDSDRVQASGPMRAMALEILSEYRLAQVSGALRTWLSEGAPSDDAR